MLNHTWIFFTINSKEFQPNGCRIERWKAFWKSDKILFIKVTRFWTMKPLYVSLEGMFRQFMIKTTLDKAMSVMFEDVKALL